MSDIEIGIGTQYDGAGVTAATRDITRLGSAQAGLGSAMMNSRGIMEGWTKSQIVGIQVSSQLTDKAIVLGRAVDRGKITFEQAQAAYNRYNAEAQKVIWSQMTMGEKLGVVADKWTAVKAAAMPYVQMGAAVVGGVYAVGKAFEQAYNFSEQGAQIQFTQQKFDNLSQSIGTTSHVLLGDLRGATHGLYSDMDLMSSATDFVGLGLANTREEAVRLSAVAAGLGMNMNQLVLTLTNKTTMRFDALGVRVDGFKEKVKALKEEGMSADDAFKEAFLQQAEAQLKLTGGLADTNLGTFMQLKAGWANWVNSIKEESGGWFSGMNTGLADYFNRGATQRNIRSNFADQLASLSGIQVKDAKGNFVTTSNQYENFFTAGRGRTNTDFQNAARAYEANATRYQGLADYYAAGGNVPGGGATIDYAAMLQGGLQLTEIQQKYGEKTAELNRQLTEEQAKLETLRTQYGDNSKQVQDQIEKVGQLKDAVAAGTQAQIDAQNQYALSLLNTSGATAQQQLDFALASGQITQGAYDQATAQQMLADAFMEGTISAEEYFKMVSNLDGILSSMDGKDIKSKITIAIETRGNAGLLGIIDQTATGMTTAAAVGNTAVGANGQQQMGGAVGDNWTGGFLNGTSATLVGDLPGGVPTPWSELIVGNYVFDARTTKKMLESGLFNVYSRAYGGDLDGGVYKPNKPRPAPNNKPRGGTKAGGSSAAGMSADVVTAAAVADVAETANASAATAVQIQESITSAINNAFGANNGLLSDIKDILIGQPRAIGKTVAYEVTKNAKN